MNQLANRREDDEDDFMFMFEHEDTSHCFDIELQRLNEETAQMGLLVNNIEKRTMEDIIRWQKILEDSRLEGKATFLQRISHVMSPGSGSSPVAYIDEEAVSSQLKKTMEHDLQSAEATNRQHRYRHWRTWFKDWAHLGGGSSVNAGHTNGKKRNFDKWVPNDSDSEGLLVMNNSVHIRDNEDEGTPQRVHSTVQARNFFDKSRLPSSSITLAEHKYLFGDNNTTSLATGARMTHRSNSSNESIISETTPGLQIAQNMKYSALMHDSAAATPTPAAEPSEDPPIATILHQDNAKGPTASCEISTPPLLQSQSKRSKSTPSILSLRGLGLRKRTSRGRTLCRQHL